MSKVILTRRQLYELIWSAPISTTLEKYEITGSKLRTTCRRMNIPLPQMGHWSKVKAGKRLTIHQFEDEADLRTITLAVKSSSSNLKIEAGKQKGKLLSPTHRSTYPLSKEVFTQYLQA